jgi:dUTPase
MMKLTSLGSPYETPPYAIGERCAQIYFEKVLDVKFEETTSLNETIRGEGGFGSTGIK